MIDFPQFVYGEVIDPQLCDYIVEWFDDNPSNHERFINTGYSKSSHDGLLVSRSDYKGINLLQHYEQQLHCVASNYVYLYPGSAHTTMNPWKPQGDPQIQKYLPGEGFRNLHVENVGLLLPSGHKDIIDKELVHGSPISRHLVYMTYLNDVEDGGTQFPLQNFVCPARKGLTIIWPAQWMFPHAGIVSFTKTKYIVTGWFAFYDQEKDKLYQ